MRTAAALPPLAATLMLAFAAPSASAAEHRYQPVKVTGASAIFALDDLVGRHVASARLYAANGKSRQISIGNVNEALSPGAKHRMRVSLSRSWRRSRRSGSTRMTLRVRTKPKPGTSPPPPPPPPPPATDTTNPTPATLSATPGVGQVALSWTAATDDVGVTHYQVWMDNGNVVDLASSARSYTVTNLAAGVSHIFRVVAYDAVGHYANSNNVTAAATSSTTTPPPPPATTPPPPPAPTGSVLWRADAEASMASEWASNSSIPAAATPPAPDPTRIYQSTFSKQGARSYRFELRDTDSVFSTERAQLAQARPGGPVVGGVNRWFYAGQERWISTQMYWPSSTWPGGLTSWVGNWWLTPVSDGGAGGNVQFAVSQGRIDFTGTNNVWGSTNSTFHDGDGPLVNGTYPLPLDKWIKLTYHVLFSADPSVGFIEIFGDLGDGQGMRTLGSKNYRATLKYTPTGAMDPAHMRMGIYRDALLSGTQYMYVDGVTVATTREAAEANSFAPPVA